MLLGPREGLHYGLDLLSLPLDSAFPEPHGQVLYRRGLRRILPTYRMASLPQPRLVSVDPFMNQGLLDM